MSTTPSTLVPETVGDRLDPTGMRHADQASAWRERQQIDASCRGPVLVFLVSAVFWLLVGSVLALIASLKLHSPGFLDSFSWLTFGRIRPAHLEIVAFGWSAMVGVGASLWTVCRLCRVPLRFPSVLVAAGLLWDVGVLSGLIGMLAGDSNSIEWIEFPPYATFMIFTAFALCSVWTIMTFAQRHEKHVYVSLWYIFGAMFWFPWIYATVQLLTNSPLAVQGVPQESIHWWFGHNTLGVFLTPMGLAAIYYLLPKVIGRPIYSYYLSILGFWSLALFYNWAGGHHLVAGPLPAWLITISAVGSVMMFIPVTTTAVNHHATAYQNFHMLRTSPVLRFVVFGAMSYTLVSFQGSMMALRVYNEPLHFTHHTIAHAHLGLYAFYTMVMFGAIYYILPRLTGRDFASASLIKAHFWLAALGIGLMFLTLTIGGSIQGFELNQASKSLNDLMADPNKGFFQAGYEFLASFKTRQDAALPFITVVRDTAPWLLVRSVSGIMLFTGHLIFAGLIVWNLIGNGRKRETNVGESQTTSAGAAI